MEMDGHPEGMPSNRGYCVRVPKTASTFRDHQKDSANNHAKVYDMAQIYSTVHS